jgi:hypothetical protein
VVVAVVAVRVVKVAGDAIIHVVAVRHRLMAATGTVHMARLVPTATMVGSAAIGVRARHFDHMFVDMIFVRVVEVTIVQIVYVATVVHGGVSAARAMLMGMVGMGRGRASGHGVSSFPCPRSADTVARLSAAWSIALRTNGSTCSSACPQIQHRCHSVKPSIERI